MKHLSNMKRLLFFWSSIGFLLSKIDAFQNDVTHSQQQQHCPLGMISLYNGLSCTSDSVCQARAVGFFCYQGECCAHANRRFSSIYKVSILISNRFKVYAFLDANLWFFCCNFFFSSSVELRRFVHSRQSMFVSKQSVSNQSLLLSSRLQFQRLRMHKQSYFF